MVEGQEIVFPPGSLFKRRTEAKKKSASKASVYRGFRPRKDTLRIRPSGKDRGVELVVVVVFSWCVASKQPVERL